MTTEELQLLKQVLEDMPIGDMCTECSIALCKMDCGECQSYDTCPLDDTITVYDPDHPWKRDPNCPIIKLLAIVEREEANRE